MIAHYECTNCHEGSPGGAVVKSPPADAGDTRDMHAQPLGQEDPMKEEIATHSSILNFLVAQTVKRLSTMREF